jgi:hypothetical protein
LRPPATIESSPIQSPRFVYQTSIVCAETVMRYSFA